MNTPDQMSAAEQAAYTSVSATNDAASIAEEASTEYQSGLVTQSAAGTGALQMPQHPFDRLPSELVSGIVDLLPPESFINFAFANYPLARRYGLAPELSTRRVEYVTTWTQIPTLFPLLNVPAELMLQFLRHLKPIDVMRFVIAHYRELARQGIAPLMTRETELELRKALGKPG